MSTAYLLPNGNGAYTDFALSGCANAWECLDDPVGSPDDAATTLGETTANSRQSVTLTDFTATTGQINSVTVTTRSRRPTTAAATIRNFVRIGGVDYDGAAQTVPVDTAYYDRSEVWPINPATGIAWTVTDINSLEAGLLLTVVGGGASFLFTQLYVTVDYTSPHIAAPLTFYLIAEKPPNALTALVNGSPTDPYMSITYDTGSAGSITPLPGMTVWFGSTSGGQERGVLRLRSWNGSNQISVAESDDVGPLIQDNDFITIKTQWRLWPKYPRALIQGTQALVLEDYDVSYTDQTLRWLPVAVAGPPSVTEYNGTTFQARFVGDRSFAVASGATISSYLWTAPGSVEGTSTSQGTEASPVTFTWTTTGQKLVYLRVTDSNGKQHTNYTWAFGVDPNNPETVAYVNFDSYNDNMDFEQGGGSCNFTVHSSTTITDFPNEAMVIMASRPTTPGQATPTGYWPNRDNVHFVGYILGNTVRQNPVSGDVTFQAATIDALMKNLTMFPVSLTYNAAPQNWTQAADLTPDRAAAFLWHYHSTLSTMTPIVRSGYSALIYRQDFGPGDLYSQLDNELLKTMWGKVVSNHQGVLHHLIDYNLMINSERSGVTVRKILHKGVWVDDLNIEERHAYSNPVSVIKASGIIYTGGSIEDVCPSFSEAPGNAPKVYGREMNYDRLILDTQANLNTRTGRALAKHTARYSQFGMRFINDGSFTIAPQELFTSNVEAADNNRGLALTTRLLPRRIARTFDNQNMLISYDVGFEPETDGPPGITVNLPCGPPAQVWPAALPIENVEPETGPVLIAYVDADDGQIKARVISYAGSLSIGNEAVVDASGGRLPTVVSLSAAKAVVCYTRSTSIYGCVLDVSGSTVTPGTPAPLSGISTDAGVNDGELDIDRISSTSALLVYRNASGTINAVVLSGMTGTTITTNTAANLTAVASYQVSCVVLSATLAIAFFIETAADALDGCPIAISGVTLTPALPAAIEGVDDIFGANAAKLDSSTVILCYNDITAVNVYGRVISGITASSFTSNARVPIVANDAFDVNPANKWVRAPSATQAVLVYQATSPNLGRIYAAGLAISGTTFTPSTPVEVGTYENSYDEYPTMALVSDTRALVVYDDQGSPTVGAHARSFTFTGSTNPVPDGNDNEFMSDSFNQVYEFTSTTLED